MVQGSVPVSIPESVPKFVLGYDPWRRWESRGEEDRQGDEEPRGGEYEEIRIAKTRSDKKKRQEETRRGKKES